MAIGVWDTAGSERYEAMSRMYYRNAKECCSFSPADLLITGDRK